MLRSEIPWPAFMNAGILTKEQLELMYQLDKQSIAVQVAQYESVRPPGPAARKWGAGGDGRLEAPAASVLTTGLVAHRTASR